MPPISSETVRRVAALSMLALPPEEEQAVAGELATLAAFAGKLDGAIPAATGANDPQPTPAPALTTPMRRDVPGAGLSTAQALMNAKTVDGGYITVPRTFA